MDNYTQTNYSVKNNIVSNPFEIDIIKGSMKNMMYIWIGLSLYTISSFCESPLWMKMITMVVILLTTINICRHSLIFLKRTFYIKQDERN